MTLKLMLCSGAAIASMAVGAANAATINLVDQGGVTGSPAEQGFKVAADYWSRILTNDVTINLGVSFAPLAPNIIGSTGSRQADFSVADWATRVNATKSNSALDRSIVLPTLGNTGGVSFITNGVDADGNDDTSVQVFNAGTSVSSKTLYMNSSVIKAIGGTLANPGALDGRVQFSSNFNFDFNPGNGVAAGTFDFIGVAIHEIGHALGFVSGVDFLDFYGTPNGPGAGTLGYSLNDTSIFSALDMFRYSADANGLAPGTGASLDLSVGTASYFSIDGGATALFGNSVSTGSFNGDGRQASHWKDATGVNRCGPQIGILDPTFCFGQEGVVTALDLAAYDAMGWNLSIDALKNGGSYQIDTGKILYQFLGSSVPEPSSWAMLIAGFGLTGAAMRRRAAKLAAA